MIGDAILCGLIGGFAFSALKDTIQWVRSTQSAKETIR